MKKGPWFGAQVIFLHSEVDGGRKQMYEERITLLKADSFKEAIKRAEKESRKYCRGLTGCEYAGLVDVFQIVGKKVDDGTEIFSSMQKSDLKAKEYLTLHYPDIPDDCEAVDENHRWYNKDGKRSACYHCKVVREGRLWESKKASRRMSVADFGLLEQFLNRVPAIGRPFGKGSDQPGTWWVKFAIDVDHDLAWRVVQELGHVLNYVSVNERLPTVFKPASPPPYMNGGPREFLSWVIECDDPEFTPAQCAEWLEGRLPRPVDELVEWEVEE
jgi:hypothetical protein